MKLHRAGYLITLKLLIVALVLLIIANFVIEDATTRYITYALIAITYVALVSFFRKPKRYVTIQDNAILSSVDGKVVVIEETFEKECLKERCIQVSVFMNVNNVHINWYPVNGKVQYVQHHDGHFKKAYLPKSSELNENTTILIERPDGKKVVMRQIAGAVARRIVTYATPGCEARQDLEAGFIKFGSRVDLFLPLDTKIKVKLGDRTRGSQTVIGYFAQ
ncbi:MAG: phosphatidylserine decarboxylase family protein [Odoribacter sp.]|nr:phosphatidylserine decarboxylase family protein [Bacteroidales bacterium]MBR2981003.1 phosphatidylserine decarboxylase family protein [Odoribacter sp.]